MHHYYAYIRVSTIKQGEKGSSLQEQRASIESFAKKNGFVISTWFEEQETAAKVGRTEFTKMIKALQKGKAAGVIIHKIDRSARNFKDWSDINELIDSGVAVHFSHDALDMSTRGGRLMADMQAVIAADYIRNLREEVRKGFYGRLKQGLYPLNAPIGYVDNGGGKPKTPHPIMGPLVRLAFEKYATGRYSQESLLEELNTLGLRNRNGNPVSLNGISTLLNNTFYYGLIRINNGRESFPGIHEPIISKYMFDAVQKQLHGKIRNTGLVHEYHFRKLIRCLACQTYLRGEVQKGNVYYRCHLKSCETTNSIRETVVETQMIEHLRTITFSAQELIAFKEELDESAKDSAKRSAAQVKSARMHLAQVDDRLARLTDAYIDRVIEREDYEERRQSLLNDRIAAQGHLKEMEDGNDPMQALGQKLCELQNALQDKDNWENAEFLKETVKKTIANLCVSEKSLVVSWFSVFEILSKRPKTKICGPTRNLRRTMRALIEELAQAIYGPLTTSPPPHILAHSEQQA